MIIILFTIICFFSDYIIIDRKINKCVCSSNDCNFNNNITNNNVSYGYGTVAGYYRAVVVFNNPYNGEQFDAGYSLHLYENGTYSYVYSYAAPFGTIGNYIIEGNKFILNNIFKVASDKSLTVTTGSKELIINNNNSISDPDALIGDVTNISSIILERLNDTTENQFNHYIYQAEGLIH